MPRGTGILTGSYDSWRRMTPPVEGNETPLPLNGRGIGAQNICSSFKIDGILIPFPLEGLPV